MKKTGIGRFSAAALGMVLLVAACGSDDDGDDGAAATTAAPAAETTAAPAAETTAAPAAETTAAPAAETTEAMADGVVCEGGVTFAFLGALSGDNGALGQNMVNGAQIAVDDFNAANPDCQVTFDTSYDSQGDPNQATPLADTIVNDDSIIALLGPGFSGETRATGPVFAEFGLPTVSPSATNATLQLEGWATFHRVLANDDLQAPGVVNLITNTIGATTVGVVDDASDYGKGLGDSVREGLGDLNVANATIDPAAADYSAAITAMNDADVEVVFYSGYYAEAAKFVTQLRDSGSTATFVSGDGSLDPQFIEGAGENAEGAYLTATGAPADINQEFFDKFMEAYGTPPGLYSPESYDVLTIFLSGVAAGNTTRESMLEWVKNYDAEGITKHITFDENGEVLGTAVFYTIVEGGELVSQGLIPE